MNLRTASRVLHGGQGVLSKHAEAPRTGEGHSPRFHREERIPSGRKEGSRAPSHLPRSAGIPGRDRGNHLGVEARLQDGPLSVSFLPHMLQQHGSSCLRAQSHRSGARLTTADRRKHKSAAHSTFPPEAGPGATRPQRETPGTTHNLGNRASRRAPTPRASASEPPVGMARRATFM